LLTSKAKRVVDIRSIGEALGVDVTPFIKRIEAERQQRSKDSWNKQDATKKEDQASLT
jgi:hypothetical protein